MNPFVTFIVGFVSMVFLCTVTLAVVAQSLVKSGDVHSVWALEHEGLEETPERVIPVAIEVE